MIGLIGKKLGMTQIFLENGQMIPVTVIKTGPCAVVQKKTKEKEGYNALQLGYEEINPKKLTHPLKGHFKRVNSFFKILKEFKVSKEEIEKYAVQDKIDSSIFKEEDFVDITGISKGKGFAGGVKRHHFKGGKMTRGSMFHRRVGSIGASSDPSRVFKGKRMAGRMGGEKITIQNLVIKKIIKNENLILIKGNIPGANFNYIIIKKSIKKKNATN